jgi:hypothetical protein
MRWNTLAVVMLGSLSLPQAQPLDELPTPLVFKDGVGYDSAKLIESVRGLVGLR